MRIPNLLLSLTIYLLTVAAQQPMYAAEEYSSSCQRLQLAMFNGDPLWLPIGQPVHLSEGGQLALQAEKKWALEFGTGMLELNGEWQLIDFSSGDQGAVFELVNNKTSLKFLASSVPVPGVEIDDFQASFIESLPGILKNLEEEVFLTDGKITNADGNFAGLPSRRIHVTGQIGVKAFGIFYEILSVPGFNGRQLLIIEDETDAFGNNSKEYANLAVDFLSTFRAE